MALGLGGSDYILDSSNAAFSGFPCSIVALCSSITVAGRTAAGVSDAVNNYIRLSKAFADPNITVVASASDGTNTNTSTTTTELSVGSTTYHVMGASFNSSGHATAWANASAATEDATNTLSISGLSETGIGFITAVGNAWDGNIGWVGFYDTVLTQGMMDEIVAMRNCRMVRPANLVEYVDLTSQRSAGSMIPLSFSDGGTPSLNVQPRYFRPTTAQILQFPSAGAAVPPGPVPQRLMIASYG